jgi:hypothetical protein
MYLGVFSAPHKELDRHAACEPQKLPTEAVSLAANTQQGAGCIEIVRQEDLTLKLIEDHRALLSLYRQVKRDADGGHWIAVEMALNDFQISLTDHVLTETIRLYAYLKQQYKHDHEAYNSIQDFSVEMSNMRKYLVLAFSEYHDISTDTKKQLAFPSAWHDVGMALAKRMAREETALYPLYSISE